MVTSLKKTWSAIGASGIMNLTVVPFGNAKLSGDTVTCQHGPDECLGNSYEQCAIHLNPATDAWFPYYECMEALGSRMIHKHSSVTCAGKANLDNTAIEACVNNPALSLKLQKDAAANTGKHSYTPWVLVDGKISPSDGDKLLAEVCAAYSGTKPAGCAKLALRSPALW